MPYQNWETIYQTPVTSVVKRNKKGKEVTFFVAKFYLQKYKKDNRLRLKMWLYDTMNKMSFASHNFSLWDFYNMSKMAARVNNWKFSKPHSRFRLPVGLGQMIRMKITKNKRKKKKKE